MFKKIIHFIKYNNIMVLIVLAIFVLGSGVFAASETGQAVIGEKQTNLSGVDNTLLLELDLANFDMEYNIERILEDEKYYYVTYTYMDLSRIDNAWQYQIQEKTRKVSKKIKKDLGDYLAEELSEEYEAKIKDLQSEQEKAMESGAEKRVEVTEYSGLIGQTLATVGRVFPNYQPVKVREIPTPTVPPTIILARDKNDIVPENQKTDNLTDVYNDYIERNDPDSDNVFGSIDNCPNNYNPDQNDLDLDGIGDLCDDDFFETDSSATTSSEELKEENTSEETSTSSKEIVEEPILEENQVEDDVDTEADVEIIEFPVNEPIIEAPEENIENNPSPETVIEAPVIEENVASELIE